MSDGMTVLFDVDGTLVDTGYIHTVCWWRAFTQFDCTAQMATIHRSVGMGGEKLIAHVLGSHSDVPAADIIASHDALYATYWPSLRPLPGARQLVRRCHDTGWTTVLASSAGARELSVLRDVLQVDDWLDHVTSSADSDQSKPAPDIVEVALAKSGASGADAVLIGDSVWDIQAGAAAGVRCIGLECGGTSAAELGDAGAVAVYRDPEDLLARVTLPDLVPSGS